MFTVIVTGSSDLKDAKQAIPSYLGDVFSNEP